MKKKNNQTGIVKVAGIWELGWNTPIMEHDLWIYPLQEFKVDAWYMSPISGIAKSPSLTEVSDIKESISANPEFTVVWVDEKADIPLKDFKHPRNALYITGRTSQSLIGMKKENDLSVYVETETNNGGLWAHQAISLVLYDRMIKSWQ